MLYINAMLEAWFWDPHFSLKDETDGQVLFSIAALSVQLCSANIFPMQDSSYLDAWLNFPWIQFEDYC